MQSLAFALLLALIAAVHSAPAAQVEAIRVPSAAMNRDIPATVVLPDAVARDPDRRFPTLYLLHGAGDNERGWLDRTPVREMADQHEFIIVSPAVGTSWYFDSPEDPHSQFETFVASELVKYVDTHYRTITHRAARALAGNSMGGHGAMFLAVRHKEMFGAAAPMSGGMDIRASDSQVGAFPENWDLKQRLGSIQTHPERWNALTVINLVDSLKDGELAISIDCGTDDFFLTVNRRLHGKLTVRGVLHNYIERPGGHSWDYWKLALPRQMAFLSRHIQGASGGKAIQGDADFPQPSPLHPNAAGAEAWAQAIDPTLAQLLGDQPIVDPQPASVIPAPRSDGSYDWMARHEAALQARETNPQIVFIGDSITHHLGGVPAPTGPFRSHRGDEFWQTICTADRPGLNLGFGADWTQHALWRLDHGALDGLAPRHVVLMIGTNNVLHGDGNAADIVAGVRACLLRIRAKTPKADVILMGVLPCRNPATHPNRTLAAQVNERLKNLAEEANISFLDLTPQFVGADGNIPASLMDDAIHPTPAGYQIWRDALSPLIK